MQTKNLNELNRATNTLTDFQIPTQVRTILERLADLGYEGYLVGGCVRDAVLGRPEKDGDVATSALPDEMVRAFSDYKVIETGLKHGTVTIIVNSLPVEVTTFRKETGYSDFRHPDSVEFAGSLRDDASRRDFTVNAMALAADGRIIDYFGGMDDIRRKILRTVGDPAERFNEDALRILRALRFASQLGFEIESGTAAAMSRCAGLLRHVSQERINSELTGMLTGTAARSVMLAYRDIIAEVLPEIRPMFDFDQKNPHHCFDVWEHTVVAVANAESDPLIRWAMLFHDIGKPAAFTVGEDGTGHFYGHAAKSREIADKVMRRLRFSVADREMILRLVELHDIHIKAEKKPLKRQLSKYGPEVLRSVLKLQRADNLAQPEKYRHRQERIRNAELMIDKIIKDGECLTLKDLQVDGNDLIALGYEGKAIGEALNSLLIAVIDGAVSNDRDALIKSLRSKHS
jgi:tRNA nucleotidyltransferase (CCA-adding enzyme)